MVLRQLLANARKWHNVQAAVITVPATFTIPQRMATVEAAQLAGLQVRCSGTKYHSVLPTPQLCCFSRNERPNGGRSRTGCLCDAIMCCVYSI